MLNYTTLEDAYNGSLTGQRAARKKRKEEPMHAQHQTLSQQAPPPILSHQAMVQSPQQTHLPQPFVNHLGNPMAMYISVLIILVFAGMIYDMRASLHEIQQTLKVIASGKKM